MSAAGQLRIRLADDRKIGKRVERFPVAERRTDQSPLLHVAEVVLAQVLVPLEQLTTSDRG